MYNCCMFQSSGKEKPHPIIAAILVLVILGTLALLRVEFSQDIEMTGNNPYSNGIVIPVDLTVDWLAVNTITVNRIKRIASPSLRNGVLRVLMFLKICSATEYLTLSSIHTTNPDYFLSIKNDIPLKLRI